MMIKKSNLTVLLTLIILSAVGGCKESLDKLNKTPAEKETPLGARAVAIIEQALADPDTAIRANAVEAVASSRLKQLLPKVASLLKDDYINVRFNAAVAVGDMNYRPARKTLEKLTKVPDENDRIAACYAMYKLGYKQYLSPLSQSAKSHDQTVRSNAVVLLGKTGNRTVLDLLYKVKDSEDSEPRVRYQAAEAIARLGDERIMDKLWTLLISKFVENKIIGICAVGALGTPKAKEILLTKLDDEILEVRLVAAEQLGLLGDTSGEPAVLDVFKEGLTDGLDRDGYQRIMVLTSFAIGRIGTEDTTGYLPRLIEDDLKLVRLAAAQAVLQAQK